MKKELDNGKTITCKIKFIDNFRIISSLLSIFVDDLCEGLHNRKYTDYKSYLEYLSTKDDQLRFKCLKRNKNYGKIYLQAHMDFVIKTLTSFV